MYLVQSTRMDIAFLVNLLVRFSSKAIGWRWNGVKHLFRYLRGTIDLDLFYSNELTKNTSLVDFRYACYLSYPYKARS